MATKNITQDIPSWESYQFDPKYLPMGEILKGGWARGVEAMKGSVLDLVPAMIDSAMGDEEGAKKQFQEYSDRMSAVEAEHPTAYKSFKDIGSVGDVFKYGLENIGELGPDMLSFATGAGIGASTGKFAARKAIEKEIEKHAEEYALKNGLEKEAKDAYAANLKSRVSEGAAQQKAVEAGAKWGQLTGLGVSSLGMNVPDTFNQIYQDTGKLEPALALGVGSVVSALDMLGPEHFINTLSRREKEIVANDLIQKSTVVPPTWKRQFAVETAKNAALEGITESTQQVLQNYASQLADEHYRAFSPQGIDDIIDAGIRGAMGGTVFGMPGAAMEAARVKREKQNEAAVQQIAQAQQTAGQQALGQQVQGTLFPIQPPEPQGPPDFELTGQPPQAAQEQPAPQQMELPLQPEPQQLDLFAQQQAQQAQQVEQAKEVLKQQLDQQEKVQAAQQKAQQATTQNIREGKLDATPVQTGAIEALTPTTIEEKPVEKLTEDNTHILDSDSLKQTGLKETKAKGSFFQKLVDKDLSNPDDVTAVGAVLSDIRKNKNISPEVKDAVQSRIVQGIERGRLLSGVDTEPDRGGVSVPSQPTQEESTQELGTPEVSGVVPTGEPAVQPTGREEAQPSTLEKPELPPGFEYYTEQLPDGRTRQGIRRTEEAPTQPAPTPVQQPAPAAPVEETEEPKGKTSQDIKSRLNVAQEYSESKDPNDLIKYAARTDNVEALPKVKSGAEELGDIYKFKNGTYAINMGNGTASVVENNKVVSKTLQDLVKDNGAITSIHKTKADTYYTGTPEFREGARPGPVPFDVSKGYKSFAPEDIPNIEDHIIVRHELKSQPATPEVKSAQNYFSKMPRIIDNLLNMSFDLAFDTPIFKAKEGESVAEQEFFKGMNGKQARLAAKWVYDNLSPETQKIFRNITHRFEIARDTVNANEFMNLVRDGIEGIKESRTDPTVDDYKEASKYLSKKELAKLNKRNKYILKQNELEDKARVKEEAAKKEFDRLRKEQQKELHAQNKMFYILNSAVNKMAQGLHPRIIQALHDGDIASALRMVAGMMPDPLAKIANKYAALVGNANVVVSNNLRSEDGRKVPGYYNPKTNTIHLDSTDGMNAHVLMHEVGHVLMSHELDNPENPLTRQLSQLFNIVKDSLDTAYGALNVHEFASEAWSNPEFRDKLREIHPFGQKASAWDKFKRAVTNFVRKILGMPPKPLESALDETDRIIDMLISPAPESRNGGLLYGSNSLRGENISHGVNDFVRKLPIFSESQKALVSQGILNAGNLVKRGLLSFMPAHALGDLADKVFPGYGRRINEIINNRGAFAHKLNDGIDVVVDKAKAAIKASPKEHTAYDDLVHESTVHLVDPTKNSQLYTHYSLVYETFDADGNPTQHTKFFTTEQARDDAIKALNKNKPDNRTTARVLKSVNKEDLAKYNELKARYNKLPKAFQDLYVMMRDAYKEVYNQYKQSILDRIDTSDITEGGKVLLRRDIMSRLMERETIDPYFALGREGDYWLSYNLKAEHTKDGMPDRAHETFKTDYERDARIKQLMALGYNPKEFDVYSKIQDSNYRKAPSGTFMNGILKVLEDNGVKNEVVDDIMQLFIHMLPETAAAKAFMNRTNAPGYSTDSVGTFVRKTRSMIHQISNMRFNHKIDAEVHNMEEYANALSRGTAQTFGPDGKLVPVPRQDNATAVEYVNEYKKRLDYMKNPKKGGLGNLLTSAPFIYTLGFNISSGIVNMANVPMIVAPYLKGKYAGANVSKAISDATKLYFNSGRSYEATALGAADVTNLKGMYSLGNYKSDSAEFKKYATLIQRMKETGQIGRSQAFEMLNADPNTDTLAKINHASGWIMHQSERMNREITAMAAYNLEMEKLAKQGITGKDAELRAANEAVYLTELTNGGISAAAAPRVAQSTLGKVFFMYKRYGVSMYYMMFKTARDALKSSNLSNEERSAAKRQLAGIVGMSALMAGAQGIPLYGLASLVWSMFADDDDDDMDTATRKYLGEFMFKGPIEYFTNLSIASRITLNDLIIRDTKGGSSASTFSDQLAQAIGGPAWGVGQRIGRGYSKMAEGNFERGLEDIMPAAIGNILKAVRYYSEGTTTLRGDPITGEVSTWNVAAQALGLAPADYTRQLEINAHEKGVDKATNEKSTKLRRQWNMARTLGDTDGMQEARDKLIELGSKHPGLGINAGTVGQQLEKSKKAYDAATKQMAHGVQFSKRMQKELLAEEKELGD